MARARDCFFTAWERRDCTSPLDARRAPHPRKDATTTLALTMVLLRSKAATSPKPRASSPVPLHWLGFADADPSSTYTSPTRLPVGSAFGIPWAEGEVDKTTAVKATADDGTDVPLQTWPAA